MPHYQRLFNDVSTIEREFRLLGDLELHPAFLAFHILSQRLQVLLAVATSPLPTKTINGTPATNQSTWPVGMGWEFRPGQAAFLGKPFAVTGKTAVILKQLTLKPGAPLLKSVLRDHTDPECNAEEGAVRDSIANAREILRKVFKLKQGIDPIPNTARGANGAWRLAEEVLRVTAKNPR